MIEVEEFASALQKQSLALLVLDVFSAPTGQSRLICLLFELL